MRLRPTRALAACLLFLAPPAAVGQDGACCIGELCVIAESSFECNVLFGGDFQGAGSTCTATTCAPPPEFGACCFVDGSCSTLTPLSCTLNGGAYQGTGTSCGSTNCPANEFVFDANTDGSYIDPTRWTPLGVPGDFQTAFIDSGTLSSPQVARLQNGEAHSTSTVFVSGIFSSLRIDHAMFTCTSLLETNTFGRIVVTGSDPSELHLLASDVDLTENGSLILTDARAAWLHHFDGGPFSVISGRGQLEPWFQVAETVLDFRGTIRPTGLLRIGYPSGTSAPTTFDLDGTDETPSSAFIDCQIDGADLHVTHPLTDNYSRPIRIGPNGRVCFDNGYVDGLVEMTGAPGQPATLAVTGLRPGTTIDILGGTAALDVVVIDGIELVVPGQTTLELRRQMLLNGSWSFTLEPGATLAGEPLIVTGTLIGPYDGAFGARITNPLALYGSMCAGVNTQAFIENTLTLDGGCIDTGGHLTTLDAIDVLGTCDIRTGGTFDWDGAEAPGSSTHLHAGSTLSLDVLNFEAVGNDGYDGVLTLDAGSTLNVSTAMGSWHLDGPVESAGGTIAGDDVVVTGDITGTIDFSVGRFEQHGRSGAAPTGGGFLTASSLYLLGADATLAVDIGGPNAGFDYYYAAIGNPFVFNGTATLDGRLEVALTNGYLPAVGTTFIILTADTINGGFAEVDAPGFTVDVAPGGLPQFDGRITLTYVGDTPGDVDGDGAVGFDDLLTVLADWGACAGCPADIDGDGTVGFADLLVVLAAWSS